MKEIDLEQIAHIDSLNEEVHLLKMKNIKLKKVLLNIINQCNITDNITNHNIKLTSYDLKILKDLINE